MGNASSTDVTSRPALQPRQTSSGSTATVRSSSKSGQGGRPLESIQRRRSIDLPDVYGKDLTFTSSAASAVEAPEGSKWARRSSTRGRTSTTGKSAKVTPTVSQTLASGVSSSPPPPATSTPAPVVNDAASASTVVQPQAPQQSISMALDAAENQAAIEATYHETSPPTADSSTTALDQTPPDAEAVAKGPETTSSPLSPPLPLMQATPFPTLHTVSATSSSLSPSAPLNVVAPPLTPPVETVVAPFVPASIAPLPLGNGASQTTSLILGQPLPIAARSRTPSNNNDRLHPTSPLFDTVPTVSVVQEDDAAGGQIPIALPVSEFPLSAEYIASPPKGPVLPAAAPITATAFLESDQKAQEAVLNATVNLDAGPDAVPTLLTWRTAAGEGAEGSINEGTHTPKSVYVTGTFANGWTTKIEMRKKKSASEFTALVALPPGQHQLKFIVDKQWQTSRNLPSATDPDGNLINYLLVRGPHYQPLGASGIGPDEDLDDASWGTDIPQPIHQLGADLDAFEMEERKHKNGQGPPPEYPYRYQLLQKVLPPSLPAPLKDVPLNKALIVAQGSGDDNSILSKPDHSILDHLCASPISKGLLSVAVTKRYRRKFVTTILYKPIVNS